MSPCPPTHFVLPDFVSNCPYPLRTNPYGLEAGRASAKWLLRGARFGPEKRRALRGLKGGDLTSQCYPDADPTRLRVVDDYIHYLFSLDDWLDEFDTKDTTAMRDYCINTMRNPHHFQTDKVAGKMTKSFFVRFAQDAGPGCKERFISTMEMFFDAVFQQARDRHTGSTPDLESYIDMRRNTSGCKPCFALIEYAGRFDLPDEVVEHPGIKAMEEASNDFVTWSNDVFSYNKEQAKNDKHNMMCVLIDTQGVSVQEAADTVGGYAQAAIDRFEMERERLPSWGPEVDRDVALYIQGMQDWIVGSLHWSYDCERYFGKNGKKIKHKRSVQLLPKEC